MTEPTLSFTRPAHVMTQTALTGDDWTSDRDRKAQPRELARAQGFGDGYLLEAPHLGRPLPKHAQVRMIGNSVCPPLAEALVRANYSEREALREAA